MRYFLVAYPDGKQPDTPDKTEVEIERWRGWFDRTGPAIVDLGNLVGAVKTASAEGGRDTGGDNPLSGHTIIHAESIDQAVEQVKACPIIGNGSIEVTEINAVSM